jgi:hypothetical protein
VGQRYGAVLTVVNSWETLSELPNVQTCLFIDRGPRNSDAQLRKTDIIEPGMAWDAAPASVETWNRVATAIQKDVERKIEGDGTSLCWVAKASHEDRPVMGVCSIKGRGTVDVTISAKQLSWEYRDMDWFG